MKNTFSYNGEASISCRCDFFLTGNWSTGNRRPEENKPKKHTDARGRHQNDYA